MALISSYPDYLPINDLDRWVGTNSTNGSTRNFTAEQIAEYLNINGRISISAQMIFRLVDPGTPTVGQFTGPANQTPIAPTTTLEVSPLDVSRANTVAFMSYLVGNNILISEQNNINNFGHFTIDSYTVKANGNYTLVLTPIFGNGNFDTSKFYDFAVFTLSSQGVPTFIFNQNAVATVWNIQHNLGKFPSITVIDTGDTVVAGEYTYIDNNNVQLNFSAAFAGKAYLN